MARSGNRTRGPVDGIQRGHADRMDHPAFRPGPA